MHVLDQLRACISALPSAMPIRAPIKQCELEFGRPNHQVPMFQNRAAMNRATSMDTTGAPLGGDSTSGGNSSTNA